MSSPGISVCVHFWRGIGSDVQQDLFVCRYRFGLFTLSIERADPLRSYRGIRQAAECALASLNRRVRRDEEGR